MAYNPVFNAYNAILNSSSYVYSAIVDTFVIVCFRIEKHYIPQYALNNKLSSYLFELMFWSR